MNKYNPLDVICTLWGENFNPNDLSNLEAPYVLFSKTFPGEIGTIGRYKNKETPYGCCSIKTVSDYPIDKRIEVITKLVNSNKEKFFSTGVTSINIDLNWYGVQGNMCLTEKELELLSSLKLPISMTYMSVEEDEIYYPNIQNGNII